MRRGKQKNSVEKKKEVKGRKNATFKLYGVELIHSTKGIGG